MPWSLNSSYNNQLTKMTIHLEPADSQSTLNCSAHCILVDLKFWANQSLVLFLSSGNDIPCTGEKFFAIYFYTISKAWYFSWQGPGWTSLILSRWALWCSLHCMMDAQNQNWKASGRRARHWCHEGMTSTGDKAPLQLQIDAEIGS